VGHRRADSRPPGAPRSDPGGAGRPGRHLTVADEEDRDRAPARHRFSQLVLFAQALRVKDLHELTGIRLTLTPDGARSHPAAAAVRAALTDYSRPTGEPPTLDALATRIEQTWQVWQAPSPWRYAQVGQELPALLQVTRAAVALHDGDERRRALREASKLYQLTRTWTKRVGEFDLSWLAADRAVTTALETDDPDMAAAAAWNLAMILSAKG